MVGERSLPRGKALGLVRFRSWRSGLASLVPCQPGACIYRSCSPFRSERVRRELSACILVYRPTSDFLLRSPRLFPLKPRRKVDGKRAGYVKQAKTLRHIVILNAGHMVPRDQGRNSMLMVENFIQDVLEGKIGLPVQP